jgi:hypothetical protein
MNSVLILPLGAEPFLPFLTSPSLALLPQTEKKEKNA